jgi:prepilin-type N-terminal cleavage/methylation domain-containing protein
MLHKVKNRKQEGFTIIEVLIVLAIAGLILLIVFLAVPALQRNSRDTQRRSDISRVLGAAQEVINNHNGDITSLTNANITSAVGTFAYYTTTTSMPAVAAGTSTAGNSDTIDSFHVWTGATCNTSGQETSTGATSRQVAITYKIESSGGTAQCTNS